MWPNLTPTLRDEEKTAHSLHCRMRCCGIRTTSASLPEQSNCLSIFAHRSIAAPTVRRTTETKQPRGQRSANRGGLRATKCSKRSRNSKRKASSFELVRAEDTNAICSQSRSMQLTNATESWMYRQQPLLRERGIKIRFGNPNPGLFSPVWRVTFAQSSQNRTLGHPYLSVCQAIFREIGNPYLVHLSRSTMGGRYERAREDSAIDRRHLRRSRSAPYLLAWSGGSPPI